MELFKLTENVYYTSFEEERDRPRLGYIKGKDFSVAIDAGHSDNHVNEFYELLNSNNLPLPTYTIITHWHWDHSFGMHAINGKSIANKKTNEYLLDFSSKLNKETYQDFINLDSAIAKEYKDNKEIIVKAADIIYENELILNNGDQDIRIFQCISPHTDDATYIYLPKDKVLFVGDATSGPFPTYIQDKVVANKLADILKNMDIKYSIHGHWKIETKEELIQGLNEQAI